MAAGRPELVRRGLRGVDARSVGAIGCTAAPGPDPGTAAARTERTFAVEHTGRLGAAVVRNAGVRTAIELLGTRHRRNG